jgi:hypothetical protein
VRFASAMPLRPSVPCPETLSRCSGISDGITEECSAFQVCRQMRKLSRSINWIHPADAGQGTGIEP